MLRGNVVAAPPSEDAIRQLEQLFKPTPPTSNPSLNFNYSPQISEEYHILDLLVCLHLAAIVAYGVYTIITAYKNRNCCQVLVNICGTFDDVLIPVLRLPHSSQLYTFRATAFVQRIAVSGFVKPKLHIRWDTHSINHKVLNKQFHLPSEVPINIIMAYRMRVILQTQFNVLFFIKDAHSSVYRLMQLANTSWAECQPAANAPQRSGTEARLLPSLHEFQRSHVPD